MERKNFKVDLYAKKIYDENRADLEKDCDDEEFMAMYEQYEAFDELEEQFMDMEEARHSPDCRVCGQ